MKRIQKEDISKEDLEYLINERLMTNKEIGIMMGCSPSFITICVNYYNIKRSVGALIKNQYNTGRDVNCKIYNIPSKEDIEYLYIEKKLSMNKIKNIFETSIPTLKKWIVNYGITVTGKNIMASKEDIEYLYNDRNMTIVDISLMLDVTEQTLGRWMKKYNIRKRTREENNELNLYHNDIYDNVAYECMNNKQWMIDAYSVCSYREIGKMLNIGYGTISKHIHNHNIETVPAHTSLNTEEFINRSNNIHKNKYDYSLVEYTNANKKVYIICPLHGNFYQRVGDHLYNEAGCPKCVSIISKAEIELQEFLSPLTTIETNNRTILEGKELDIFLPELNTAIEYNGLYWHSERSVDTNYHQQKTQMCNDKGIRLIHIWEDDWNNNQDKIKNWLLGILNLHNPQKIYGRKTTVGEIDPSRTKELFDAYHIQGYVASTKCMGLFYRNILISACLFKKDKQGWNLTRYVTNPKYQVIGGFSKIIKNFHSLYPKTIYTFADLSWVSSGDNVYTRNGFKAVKTIPPDYRYIYNKERKHKFGFRHIGMKTKLENYDPNLTERQNCLNNEVYRIYDCGKIKYEYGGSV